MVTRIMLCSFWSLPQDWTAYSIARRQPGGFSLDSIQALAPFDANGRAITIRSAGGTPEHYREAYYNALRFRHKTVVAVLKALQGDIALACWCNSKFGSGGRQVEQFGSFVCHTVLVGQIIKKVCPDYEVLLDEDRKRFSYYKL